ncbi:MAG TPA: DUF362 domain-containing protein [Planctomycetes bacterium]|nr:DUF362 domain-containing protein [Planctomycetota bacterium]
MSKQSRRQFLAHSAVLGASALAVEPLWALVPVKRPAMTIARWAGSGQLSGSRVDQVATRLTEKAIEGLGGLGRFVRRGDVVWIKPNMAWDRTPELAANTNPAVVATLVRLCFEAGAKTVKVGDNPCDIAQKSYGSSGIAAAVQPLGAKVVYLDRRRFRMTNIGGQRVKSVPLYPEVLDCDVLINVPVAKHHRLAGLTMCMKNYMGVMENRRVFHQAIPECLTDLTRFMKPRTALSVLDCVRVLNDHGPKGGNPEDVLLKTTVAAGVDPVALDAFGAELMGRKPEQIGSIVKGDQAGLGTMDYRSLGPKEIAVS